MNHERIRELLALRLYGENDSAESQILDEHLRGCPDCARFERELASGLGRARELRPAQTDLSADWEAGLADRTAALARGRWLREALLVAAGLAAGVLLMLALRPREEGDAGRDIAVRTAAADAPAFLRFQGDRPPPLATSGGPGTRFLAWQAR
jgi:Putative zinc-finger